jgi:hypothetical protein
MSRILAYMCFSRPSVDFDTWHKHIDGTIEYFAECRSYGIRSKICNKLDIRSMQNIIIMSECQHDALVN